MKKIKLAYIIALMLCLSIVLSACNFSTTPEPLPDPNGTFFAPTSATAETTEPTTEPTEPSTYTPYDEYERPNESRRPECSFDEIEYTRPDAQQIIDDFNDLTKRVESGIGAEEFLEIYIPIDDACYDFMTMNSYSYIRYTLNLNDSYYEDEYNWCEEQLPLIAQAEEKCFIAITNSAIRNTLEEKHFGEDFFDFYEEHQIYSNDRVVALMQEESALESDYMALQSDQTIVWNGEEVLFDELVNSPDLDYTSYLQAMELYYDKYTPRCAEIYIKLIKIRNEIAAELEYDSYADFAYEYHYKRDYTPEQVDQYLNDIAAELNPLYYTAAYCDYSDEMDTQTTMELLQGIAYTFGNEIATAYDYMLAYNLYDISESSSKMPGSYMTYLFSYEMPYMYVSPTNDISDLMTATHEFGHFVDAYVNCCGTDSKDCNEIFSQALEFLAIDVADLTDTQKENLRKSQAANAVITFLGQACYADFESQVYLLPEEELTAEKFSEIFTDCYSKYLHDVSGFEEYIGPDWSQVQHFFIAPQYIISYCVSLDAALQVYQCELNDGNGLEVYFDLMSRSADNTILALLEESDMVSPFSAGRMAELADFLQKQMN